MDASELPMKNNVARNSDPWSDAKKTNQQPLTIRVPRAPALNEQKLSTWGAAEEEGQDDEGELAKEEYRQCDYDEVRPAKNEHRKHTDEQQPAPTRWPKAKATEDIKSPRARQIKASVHWV
jgi:hypothetical protein